MEGWGRGQLRASPAAAVSAPAVAPCLPPGTTSRRLGSSIPTEIPGCGGAAHQAEPLPRGGREASPRRGTTLLDFEGTPESVGQGGSRWQAARWGGSHRSSGTPGCVSWPQAPQAAPREWPALPTAWGSSPPPPCPLSLSPLRLSGQHAPVGDLTATLPCLWHREAAGAQLTPREPSSRRGSPAHNAGGPVLPCLRFRFWSAGQPAPCSLCLSAQGPVRPSLEGGRCPTNLQRGLPGTHGGRERLHTVAARAPCNQHPPSGSERFGGVAVSTCVEKLVTGPGH